MNEEQINHMILRFLVWKLPPNFNPDGGISFERLGNKGLASEFVREPSGTNLLTADQAKAMIEYMVQGLPV
jgi:hypothetical protein